MAESIACRARVSRCCIEVNRSRIHVDFSSNKRIGIWKARRQGKGFYLYSLKPSAQRQGAQLVCAVERKNVLQSRNSDALLNYVV